MASYIIRRILSTLPIALGVLLVTFVIFNVVGGNPVYHTVGKNPTPEQIEYERKLYGLDKPLFFNPECLRTNAVKYAAVHQGLPHTTDGANILTMPVEEHRRILQKEYNSNWSNYRQTMRTLRAELRSMKGQTNRDARRLFRRRMHRIQYDQATTVPRRATVLDVLSAVSYDALPDETRQEITNTGMWKRYRLMCLPAFFNSQFFETVVSAVTFRWGVSNTTRQPVSEMFREGMGPSLAYMIPAFILSVYIAVSLSLIVAYWRGTLVDRLITVLAVMGLSIPSLVTIIIAQQVFGGWLKWFPVHGYMRGLAGIPFYILPALIYIATAIGGDVRFYRSVMLGEIKQDYIRTARAKGVSKDRLLFGHLLPNVLIPILTRLIVALPFLFLGSMLLEYFFGIPGLGGKLIEAINDKDWRVIRAFVFLDSLLYIVFNLISDILYTVVDPRIRLGKT